HRRGSPFRSWQTRTRTPPDPLPVGDDRAIAAALALTGAGHPLFDQAAVQIGINEPAFGITYGDHQRVVGDPLAALEPAERLEPKDPHCTPVILRNCNSVSEPMQGRADRAARRSFAAPALGSPVGANCLSTARAKLQAVDCVD